MIETVEKFSNETTEWTYQDENVLLVPYVDGTPCPYFNENFLFWLHSRCKADNLLDILFPGMPAMTVAKFVGYLSGRPIMVGFRKSDLEVLGFGFLMEVEGKDGARKATVGFCFFRKWWGSSLIRDISRITLRWWFCEAKITILFGSTLWRNRLAWRFARGLGFESVGRVPMFFCKNGILEDMHFVYLTADRFLRSA